MSGQSPGVSITIICDRGRTLLITRHRSHHHVLFIIALFLQEKALQQDLLGPFAARHCCLARRNPTEPGITAKLTEETEET